MAFGKLNEKNIGFSMPVDSPYYNPLPHHFHNVSRYVIKYETNKDAALALLPDCLELVEPATAVLAMGHYDFCTVGTFMEGWLGIVVKFKGKTHVYVPHIICTNDLAVVAGREVIGFPKKVGYVDYYTEGDTIIGKVKRPSDWVLVESLFKPEKALDPSTYKGSTLVCLRVIPNPEKPDEPSLVEVIESESTAIVKDYWKGWGTINFPTKSEIDPWHKLKVKEIIDADLVVSDITVHRGNILHKYV